VRKIFIAIAVMLSVALVAGTIFWYFVLYQKPVSETNETTTKPTPGVGFGNLSPYSSLCAKFQKTKAKISCEKAVELALAQAPGKVKNVSVAPVRTSVPSSSGSIERRTIDMWLIDIVLAKPYFDEKFKKQISILQVGIPLDNYNLIYKKPLK
jgi:hypothetical protein